MLREWTNLRKFCSHLFCQCIIDGNYPESEGRDKLLSKGYNPRPQAQPVPERSSGTAKEKPGFPSVPLEDLLLHPHAHPTPLLPPPLQRSHGHTFSGILSFHFWTKWHLALTRHFQSSWSPLKCWLEKFSIVAKNEGEGANERKTLDYAWMCTPHPSVIQISNAFELLFVDGFSLLVLNRVCYCNFVVFWL